MGQESNQVSIATEATHTTNDEDQKDEKHVPVPTPPQKGTRLVILLAAAFVSMFLVALDRTIITTAIPRITDEFDSLSDIGWYGGAYLLTCCSFQLLFGKLYTFFPIKPIFLSSTLLFEVGSVVCGAAPSSVAFILGRAICGVGAAGIFAGSIMVVVHAVPLEKRPRLQGLFGSIFGIASILGPLVGGAFTSKVTWRWCFYINLPFGGLAMVILALCLKLPHPDSRRLSTMEKLLQLDFPGTAALVPSIVCLLLALQWGGQRYDWSNGRIIALLTISGVLMIVFGAVQIWLPATATLPPRILRQRSVIAAFVMIFSLSSSMYIFVFFLPLWFQSITGVSAVESGIRFLPTILVQVVASIVGGFATQKIGYYTPFAIAGACIMAVGAGLLTTLRVHTGEGLWIGYQILFGFGTGLGMQAPNLAAQTVLPKMDVPIGITLMVFAQGFGPAIFTSVGQNVLDNQLLRRLSWLPDFSPALVTSGGATSLLDGLSPTLHAAALADYNEALRRVFLIGLIMSCLSALGAVSLEWKSVQKKTEASPALHTGESDRREQEPGADAVVEAGRPT